MVKQNDQRLPVSNPTTTWWQDYWHRQTAVMITRHVLG